MNQCTMEKNQKPVSCIHSLPKLSTQHRISKTKPWPFVWRLIWLRRKLWKNSSPALRVAVPLRLLDSEFAISYKSNARNKKDQEKTKKPGKEKLRMHSIHPTESYCG